jgi:hypothetical protein
MLLTVSGPKFFVRAEGSGRHINKAVRSRLKPKDIKLAIQHAQLVCYGYEDTPACRVAWDRVEEISSAFARQRERELIAERCEEDELSCREYDV